MSDFPAWQFDELKQVGKDYADVSEVEAFDVFHGQFRDVKKENERIIETLSIQKQHSVIEFGSATGAFAIQASSRAKQVYAVDVSSAMLAFAEKKAALRGISNITFCHGGFLTYEHTNAPVDFVVSSLALYHLPDFWKDTALRRLHALLNPGGRFWLYDVVYIEKGHKKNIQEWIESMEKIGGTEAVEDVTMHVREEYSTFTWVMEGLLENAGFTIDHAQYDKGVLAEYICSRK